MQDWERVIEERRRMERMMQKSITSNIDQKKVFKRRSEEEKLAAIQAGVDGNHGEPGNGGLEGIDFWTIEGDFIVS